MSIFWFFCIGWTVLFLTKDLCLFYFHPSWLFGEFGCQLYAFVGFYIGIGVIFSLGLVIVDVYLFTRGKLQIYVASDSVLGIPTIISGPVTLPGVPSQSWIMLTISWHLVFLFSVPPLLGVFGRYGLEPSGSSCTIDYWHGDFRSYKKFILYVMVFAYLIPVSVM